MLAEDRQICNALNVLIAQDFTLSRKPVFHTHPLSTWNFGMISLEQIDASLMSDTEDRRLIFRFIIFKEFKNTRSANTNVTDTQTDGRLTIA